MPYEFEFPHLIYLATLDAIFYMVVVAVAKHGATLTEAAVPYMMESLFILFRQPTGVGFAYAGFS